MKRFTAWMHRVAKAALLAAFRAAGVTDARLQHVGIWLFLVLAVLLLWLFHLMSVPLTAISVCGFLPLAFAGTVGLLWLFGRRNP